MRRFRRSPCGATCSAHSSIGWCERSDLGVHRTCARTRAERAQRENSENSEGKRHEFPIARHRVDCILRPVVQRFSQSENLFTIPGEKHGREEECEERRREEGRQEVLGEEGRGEEGWRQEGGEGRKEAGQEGGEAHPERSV